MKAVILAGGLGSRLSEETSLRPKPMVEVGGRPILWHIMKMYGHYGINDFIICLGYKGYLIKEYFANYSLHMSDVTISLDSGNLQVHRNNAEPWRVTLIDTGDQSMTGGRLRRVASHLDQEDFCMTYGDGVSNIDISKLINHHKNSGRLATVTAVKPPGRFGSLELIESKVNGFNEKIPGDGNWINGGFFVLSPKVIKYIDSDNTIWEKEPLERLAKEGQLDAYKHNGFWSPMDTLRDKNMLDELWIKGEAPWKTW